MSKMHSVLCLLIFPALAVAYSGQYVNLLELHRPRIEDVVLATDQINVKIEQLFNTANLDGLMELYTDHATLIANGKRLEGKEDIKNFLATERSTRGIRRLVIYGKNTVRTGSVVLHSGTFTIFSKERRTETGSYVQIFRETNGTLLIETEIDEFH